MDLEMVLNELSLRPPASDKYDARQRMDGFIKTIVQATSSGVKTILRTSSTLHAEELAPDYPVARWLNDPQVDRDIQRFFRTLTTKAPFLVDVNDKEVQDAFGLSEFFYEERPAIGLGVAFLLDSLAVSLRSDPCWYESHIRLKISQLDDYGEIAEDFEDIAHASSGSHITEHLPWIRERLRANAQANVQKGLDIWQHKEEWFPHLYFSEKVSEQLQDLYQGNLMLGPVLKWLQALEAFCNRWLDGPFDQNKISKSITLDSPPTIEKYWLVRTFLCHDGEMRTFSWHVKMTPKEWRMYFYPLEGERKLIIGYIGPHLPTVKFH